MIPSEPNLALAGSDRFYELGVKLRENGPELLDAAQDTANWALGTAALFAFGACLAGAHHGSGPLIDLGHRALFRRPGEVFVGYRTLGLFGRMPVYLPLPDRFTGLQMVAPMGQAKTSTMEWLAYQDLQSGLSVFVVETEGDLGRKLLPLALWLGVPIRYFTYAGASTGSSMKWNPLAGDKIEAAERAVTAFQSAAASGDEKFFENFNSMFLRHSVLAVCTHAEREGREATMSDLDRFVQNESFRRKVLGVERDAQGKRFTVNARGLPRRTHGYWQDLYYGQYGQRERTLFPAQKTHSVEGRADGGSTSQDACSRDRPPSPPPQHGSVDRGSPHSGDRGRGGCLRRAILLRCGRLRVLVRVRRPLGRRKGGVEISPRQHTGHRQDDHKRRRGWWLFVYERIG